jgi:hypothetical protein
LVIAEPPADASRDASTGKERRGIDLARVAFEDASNPLSTVARDPVKIMRKRIVRWTAAFRALGPTELLLIYSDSAPHSGMAVRHSHPGNHHPHVHVESREPHYHHHHDHEHESDHRYDHEDEHLDARPDQSAHSRAIHHEGPEGHWHLAIPGHEVRGIYALLILAFASVWLAIGDCVAISDARRSRASARAPPFSSSH